MLLNADLDLSLGTILQADQETQDYIWQMLNSVASRDWIRMRSMLTLANGGRIHNRKEYYKARKARNIEVDTAFIDQVFTCSPKKRKNRRNNIVTGETVGYKNAGNVICKHYDSGCDIFNIQMNSGDRQMLLELRSIDPNMPVIGAEIGTLAVVDKTGKGIGRVFSICYDKKARRTALMVECSEGGDPNIIPIDIKLANHNFTERDILENSNRVNLTESELPEIGSKISLA